MGLEGQASLPEALKALTAMAHENFLSGASECSRSRFVPRVSQATSRGDGQAAAHQGLQRLGRAKQILDGVRQASVHEQATLIFPYPTSYYFAIHVADTADSQILGSKKSQKSTGRISVFPTEV